MNIFRPIGARSKRAGRVLTLGDLIALPAAIALVALLASDATGNPSAWVTNRGSNSVTAIELPSLATREIGVGVGPVGIAADDRAGFIYVANGNSASISRININTDAVDTLSLPGSIPEAVAVSRTNFFVVVTSMETVPFGMGSRGRVYIIDSNSFSLVTTVLVADDPEGVHVSVDGDNAWMASDLEIQELDLAPGPSFLTLTNVIMGIDLTDDFEDLISTDDKSILFATNELQNRIDVISLSTEMIIASVPTGSRPEDVVIRPGSNEVHVTNQGANSVTVFNATTFAPITTFGISGVEPRGMAFTPDGATGFVVTSMSNAVVTYNAATHVETGAPIAVGVTPEEIVVVNPPSGARTWNVYE